MYVLRSTLPQITGARNPACCATSVKRGEKGNPEGFPRGEGLTFRVAIPWPRARRSGTASSLANRRRVHMPFQATIAAQLGWPAIVGAAEDQRRKFPLQAM